MIRELSETEFREKCIPVLRKIVQNDNPYDKPIALNVEAKLVIHDYRYIMESPLLEAVVDAARQLKERGFYISILNRPKSSWQDGQLQWLKEGYHWYVPLDDIDDYPTLGSSFIPPDHNVVYSENGLWAIMGSDEHFGILGGVSSFVEVIRKHIPNLDNQVHGFLEEWLWNKNNFNSKTDWIPRLLSNIYAQQTIKELLQEHHLS